MSRYPSYKPSGIEWIGDIPEHWEMIKLKYLGRSLIGLSYKPEDIVEDETKGLLVLRSSNIQNGELSLNDNVYVKSKVKDDIIVRQGDILICSRNGSRSLIGKNITITKELEGNTFGVFMTIFRTPYWNYLSKVFNSMIFTNQSGLFLTSTINQLTQDTLNNFVVPFIHNEYERSEIVNFLDEKTKIIDKLISTKERKIELLKEQRISLINQIITKGLNPNRKMKLSGVEWIGDIPEHWVVSKLKYDSSTPVQYGMNISGDNYKEEGIRFIRITDLTENGELIETDGKYLEESQVPKEFLLNKYDVLFCRSGHTVGKSYLHLIDGKFTSGGYLVRFNFRNYSESKFIFYLGKSDMYWDWIRLNTVISTIENVNGDKFSNFQYPKPPIPEQIKIVEYLDIQTNEIDDLVIMEQKKIDLLKEYRLSLISEVITGKIDVRTIIN